MGFDFIVGIVFVIIAIVFIVYYNNHTVMLTQYSYSKVISDSFNGFKILQVSDLHGDLPPLKQRSMLKLIAQAQPDLIVVTGDSIDNIHIKQKERVYHFLETLHKQYQLLLVTGNHEYMHKECFEVLQEIERRGIACLHNQSVEIKRGEDTLAILGLDDPYAIYQGDVPEKYCTPREEFIEVLKEQVSASVSKSAKLVLLSHRPEYFEEYCEAGVDIVFAGHAHGGQWRLPIIKGIIAPDQGLFPRYTEGEYEKNYTTMYVSRGLGNSVVPLRLWNRPELLLVKLCCDKKSQN